MMVFWILGSILRISPAAIQWECPAETDRWQMVSAKYYPAYRLLLILLRHKSFIETNIYNIDSPMNQLKEL